MNYWPWWAGAICLGMITVGYYRVVGKTLGVSGAWERVLHWREEREVERLEDMADGADFEAAMLAETKAAFGEIGGADQDGDTVQVERLDEPRRSDIDPAPEDSSGLFPGGRLPVSSQAFLMVGLFVGGLLAAITSGRFQVRGDMGPEFAEIVVGGWWMWPVLLLGGIMVGIGTRMTGGCSSGHGLSGCGRLQPVSILSTSIFFGSAVVVSSLLRWVI